VTHDQTEALTFADKVVVMHDGRVVQVGTPQELFERPAHTFVGYFIGSPGMNLLEAQIAGDVARVGGEDVPLGAEYAPPKGRVQIGVRPEFVRLGDEGLPVTVTRVEDVGRHRIARLDFEGIALNAILPEGAGLPAEGVRARFEPETINVYSDDWRVTPNSPDTEAA